MRNVITTQTHAVWVYILLFTALMLAGSFESRVSVNTEGTGMLWLATLPMVTWMMHRLWWMVRMAYPDGWWLAAPFLAVFLWLAAEGMAVHLNHALSLTPAKMQNFRVIEKYYWPPGGRSGPRWELVLRVDGKRRELRVSEAEWNPVTAGQDHAVLVTQGFFGLRVLGCTHRCQ